MERQIYKPMTIYSPPFHTARMQYDRRHDLMIFHTNLVPPQRSSLILSTLLTDPLSLLDRSTQEANVDHSYHIPSTEMNTLHKTMQRAYSLLLKSVNQLVNEE